MLTFVNRFCACQLIFALIISPHCMRALDAGYCYRPRGAVCVCQFLCTYVDYDHERCKNGWTDRDAVWESAWAKRTVLVCGMRIDAIWRIQLDDLWCVLSLPILQQLDWRKRDVFVAGPPGVYSPDVAGLYMSEQHMMRPPGKISTDYRV